ncbi:M28 family metallopeptidase [Treponema denticola]|uniref:M28 family metallopeptidase n=1 Tax=Treponema denticola TaxID=158 RepID=UPI0021F81EAD|nr:M28 family metallopeptidase [Treponema denticola]UYT08091.1 M28 family metallopeptidase [Treponema denticola]
MIKENEDKLLNSDLFKAFLKKDLNRCDFISQWLSAHNVPHSIVNLAQKKHIIIKYPAQFYDKNFKMKTLTAHYDRAPDTQGANDNSASCFILMNFAKKLCSYTRPHNIKIIFTDGEEAGAAGLKEQGAYTLGTGLKKLKMDGDDIFVFDMCGRGDTLILSRSGIFGRDKAKTKRLDELHKRAGLLAQRACPNQWLSMLTAYSDNAGFIAAGLFAQVITVLPRKEAETLLHCLPKEKLTGQNKTAMGELTDMVIKNQKPPQGSPFEKIIPFTWQLMHTADDKIETLNSEAFTLTEKYLTALAENYR